MAILKEICYRPVWKSRDRGETILRTEKRLTCRYCGGLTRYLLGFSSGDSIPLCRDCLYAHIVNNRRTVKLSRRALESMRNRS